MEIKLDLGKSAQENANDHFYSSKRAKKKREGAQLSVVELERRLEKEKGEFEKAKIAKKIKIVTKKEWYEKFHYFFASNGSLVIGGRDAAQNELLNSRHFEEHDLFFHADIFGASVTILKGGLEANMSAKEEAAQFSACYSSAWKAGNNTVDVYAMRREQISKSKSQGSLGTGSFAMKGEREWYKSQKLGLVAFVSKKDDIEMLNVVPEKRFEKMQGMKGVRISIGNLKKSDAAKLISKKLGFEDIDTIIQQLPAGEFSLK